MDTSLEHMPVIQNVMFGPYKLNSYNISTSHSVDRSVGIATVDFIKPVLGGLDINSPIKITAGYLDGEQGMIFSGKVVYLKDDFDDDAARAQIKCEGSVRNLRNGQEDEINANYLFGYKLADFIRLLLEMREVATYLVDRVTVYPAIPLYTDIRIAGNSLIGPESNRIPGRTNLLSWANQKLGLYGYRIYDTGDGTVRVSRVSGIPSSSPVATFTEGDNIFNVSRTVDVSQTVNWWTVYGARFMDGSGITIQIRNSPAIVPTNPDLDPPGYRHEEIRDAWIQNDDNALVVRSIAEVDNSARQVVESWETWGQPNLAPGDIVSIVSPTTNPAYLTDAWRWVLSVDHRISDGEFTTNIDAWAGGGTALPEANDCVTTTVGGGSTYHVGDMVRDNFEKPIPDDKIVKFPITVPGTPTVPYTSMSIHGYAHGCNHGSVTSQNNPPRNLSTMEVWQSGVKISSVELPVFFDSLTIDYSSPPTNWQPLHLPLPGSLLPGAAEVRFLAGDDVDLFIGFPYDDYEIRGLSLRTCGIGTPVIP